MRMAEHVAAPAEPRAVEKKRGFALPSAYTILFALIVITALATWIIPAGRYALDPEGSPIPGSYQEVDKPRSARSALEDPCWHRPHRGLAHRRGRDEAVQDEPGESEQHDARDEQRLGELRIGARRVLPAVVVLGEGVGALGEPYVRRHGRQAGRAA